ncbi:hypothetical protein F4861DRAFT_505294 [Xylaria intraflava]|nr:hypothetical protein F4861DRAFT_505294 [Xylaria intraflava]
MTFGNMMTSVYGANVSQCVPSTYTTHPVLDDFSSSRLQQRASPDSYRRISRSHNGPQRASNAMRVVKPSSANNSPQSMMARRRTLMNDGGIAQRRQQAFNQAILQQLQDPLSYHMGQQDLVGRNGRPVSWHPGSHALEAQHMHLQIPQVDFSQYAMAMPTPYHPNDFSAGYHNLPPTPAAYSGHTSPVSGYSPLLGSYAAPATQSNVMPAYVSSESWVPSPPMASNCANAIAGANPADMYATYMNQGPFNWHTYSPQELGSCTAPPTPDEFRVVQQPQTVPPEESIPYESLDKANQAEEEEEDEGEILIGMGLYDTPSKTDTDPELDYYRTTTSHLLNTTYRNGKGWKLEESWEPPATDEEDNEEDADDDEQGKELKTTESPPAQQPWI